MNKLDPVDTILRLADSQPDQPAVIENKKAITYHEFLSTVMSMAAEIPTEFEGQTKVLIYLPQCANAYAAMFATLMAGGYYSPINLESPIVRRKMVIDQFQPEVIITSLEFREEIEEITNGSKILYCELLNQNQPGYFTPKKADGLAYVIFTSGSTGVPKGVMIERKSLLHYLNWAVPALDMKIGDKCSQHPNIGFDLSVLDIFSTLCSGATLIPITGKKYRMFPAEAIKEYGISIWISVPSVINLIQRGRQFNRKFLRSIRKFLFCGEPLLREHLELIFSEIPGCKVINTYGPTEATVSCTELHLSAEDYFKYCTSNVSIGRAIPGMQIDLVGGEDDKEGEIVIAGPQLMKGYWQDDDKTISSFRFNESKNEIYYFTGDWAKRFNKDIYFIKRVDRQIKIHGNRLELGDVDNAIRQCGFMTAATVFIKGRIVSFIELSSDHFDKADLTQKLAEKLPSYAVPAEICTLKSMPRNVNDKIDVQALKGMVEKK